MQATQRQAVSTGLFRIRRVSISALPRGFCRWLLLGCWLLPLVSTRRSYPKAIHPQQYIRNNPYRGGTRALKLEVQTEEGGGSPLTMVGWRRAP